MLVLSRKLGEKIRIDHHITLSVLEVRGDYVKLGFDAPRHISIHRQEVYDDILAANQAAGSAPTQTPQGQPLPSLPSTKALQLAQLRSAATQSSSTAAVQGKRTTYAKPTTPSPLA